MWKLSRRSINTKINRHKITTNKKKQETKQEIKEKNGEYLKGSARLGRWRTRSVETITSPLLLHGECEARDGGGVAVQSDDASCSLPLPHLLYE